MCVGERGRAHGDAHGEMGTHLRERLIKKKVREGKKETEREIKSEDGRGGMSVDTSSRKECQMLLSHLLFSQQREELRIRT